MSDAAERNAALPADAARTLERMQQALSYTFDQPYLLRDALTHRSYLNEHRGPELVSNERLEFLGDAVLALISGEMLYRERPQAHEGELTQLRAALVRTSTLAGFARRFELGEAIRSGKSEQNLAGREREPLLASTFEAVLGAIYLDAGEAGLARARQFLHPLLAEELEHVIAQRRVKDDKSRLQELAQGRLGITPRYHTANETGPSHQRTFEVEVLLGEVVLARGEGTSKQQAEQNAAHAALQDQGWADSETPAPTASTEAKR